MSGFRVSKAKALARQDESTTRSDILENAVVTLERPEDVVEEITKLWGEAQNKFLTIGRYLVQAAARFTAHRRYEREVVSKLPFSRQIAHQLRVVAMAVDEGRLVKDELPRSYATVYILATLTDEHLNLARQQGLVCPEATRPQVEAFRRSLLPAAPKDLARRRERLMADIQKREAELARMRAELEEVEQALGTIDGEVIEVV